MLFFQTVLILIPLLHRAKDRVGTLAQLLLLDLVVISQVHGADADLSHEQDNIFKLEYGLANNYDVFTKINKENIFINIKTYIQCITFTHHQKIAV